MSQDVAMQGIQGRIVDVGGQHAFSQVVQNYDPRRTTQPPKCLFMQLGPHPRTRPEGQ